MATEARLDAIRKEALAHGAVDAAGVRLAGAPFPQPSPETGYYGLPLLKPPTWTWEVPAYLFVGGAAGASAVIAAITRDDALGRDARWIAAGGSAVSAALLVADLGRPERFLYMLRVFKLRSPMSVGAWTLSAFSSAASAAAFADAVERLSDGRIRTRLAVETAGAAAAATGLVMASYTGVLLGVTTIPVWNRHARLLPLHFTASALGSAVSILEILGHDRQALRTLGLLAAAAETAAGTAIEWRDEAVSAPLKRGASGWITRAGAMLAGPVPLLLRLAGRRSPVLRRAAAAAAIAGAVLTRTGWWAAGSSSAGAAGPRRAGRRRPPAVA